MKPFDVKISTCTDSGIENNDRYPIFKVGDHAKISKYKNIFAKGYVPNLSKEVSVIIKLKILCSGLFISDLIGEETSETFYEKELQKQSQKESRVEIVIKRKNEKLYVKWKSYDNLFNSWIYEKDSVIQMSYFSEPYTHSKNKIVQQNLTLKRNRIWYIKFCEKV